MLSKGKPIFTGEHVDLLANLFYQRFEGFSANTVEGMPPWQGSWLPQGAREPIVDRHMLLVIYTIQDETAKTFFRYLKSILELKEVANQEVVVVELIPVWLMEGNLLPPES